jgi:hypothetical protein
MAFSVYCRSFYILAANGGTVNPGFTFAFSRDDFGGKETDLFAIALCLWLKVAMVA